MLFIMAGPKLETGVLAEGGEQVLEWTHLSYQHHDEELCEGPGHCEQASALVDCLLKPAHEGWWDH
jgi:hypothetical protein